MKELEAYRMIMADLPEGIQEAEAEAEKNDRILAGRINKEENGMSASDKTVIFVRASGTKTGMTYTQNLEADPKKVLLEALHNSEFVQEEKPELLNKANKESSVDNQGYVTLEEYKEASVNHHENATLEEYKEASGNNQEKVFLMEDKETSANDQKHVSLDKLLEKAAELEKIVNIAVPDASHISVIVSENLRTTGIVNSYGLNRTYTKRIAEAELVITCENGLHRTLELETSAPSVEEIPTKYFMDKIREWLIWPTNITSFHSAKLPTVLDGSVMCNIFLTAWQMFSGYQYLNRSTPFYGELGKKIFPDILSISDIPETAIAGYGRQFDCEGTSSQQVDVVKEGKLQALMHNLTTANKSGEKSTGNAGRDVNLISDQTECKVIPTNFTLLPGQSKKEELLASLEDGIYICKSYDMFHSVNSASGDFSIPCQGICYCKGKPVGRVEGITINGNLSELLKNITRIADDRTTVSMVMSKSFAISAASVLVKSLLVTGGQIESM